MAIGLGRSIGSPAFLFFQIIHGVSLFFVMLGVSRVLLGMLELTLLITDTPTNPQSISKLSPPRHRRPGLDEVYKLHPRIDTAVDDPLYAKAAATEVALPFSAQLSNCFHVPLQSLFHAPVAMYAKANDGAARPLNTPHVTPYRYDGSIGRFYLQHFCAAFFCSYPLALLLQRRKFVLDFVVTIYVAYWLFTDVVLQAVLGGGTLHWWASCLLGMATMYASTYLICRKKEMQEVKLTSGGGGGGGSTPASTFVSAVAVWLKDSRGNDVDHSNKNGSEDAREMEEIQPVFQDTFSSTGAAAAVGSAVAGVLQDKAGGRGRVAAGATSPKPVVVDVSGAEENLLKSKFV
ncbi:Integral membrane protein S linking to the trans Golgi network [Lotmaria passim]